MWRAGLVLVVASCGTPPPDVIGPHGVGCTALAMADNGPPGGASAVGDFNGDGLLDVIGPNMTDFADSITLYYGHGDGTFTVQAQPACAGAVLAVGDFDGDGVSDIASLQNDEPVLGVAKGGQNCDVIAGATVTVDPNVDPYPQYGGNLVVGDFDGDGFLDIAYGGMISVADLDDDIDTTPIATRLSVWFGNGDLTFQPEYDLDVFPYLHQGGEFFTDVITAADVDGDGRPDLVIPTNQGLAVYLSRPGRIFAAAVMNAAINPSAVGGPYAVGDANGDGKLDILDSQNAQFDAYLGNGDGTFGAPIVSAAPSHFSTAIALVAGDWDTDGKLDVAAIYGDVTVLAPGAGDGTFTPGRMYRTPQGRTIYDGEASLITTADTRGDGHTDLVFGPYTMLGNGDGTFEGWQAYDITGGGYSVLATADFDGDGNADVVASFGDTIQVFLGDGTGNLAPGPMLQESATETTSLAVADVDGDRVPDVLAFYPGGASALWLGHGDGTFGAAIAIPVGGDQWAVGDVNGDRRADLVVQANNVLTIFVGAGDGSFTQRAQYTDPACPPPSGSFGGMYTVGGIAIADLDHDGHADLVIGGCLATTVRYGVGDGTFLDEIAIAGIGTPGQSIAVGDVDADGRLDVEVAAGGATSVWFGTGDRLSMTSPSATIKGVSGRVDTGDFDGDGVPDVAITTSGNLQLWSASPTAVHPLFEALPSATGFTRLVDLDHDGRADVVEASGGFLDVLVNRCR